MYSIYNKKQKSERNKQEMLVIAQYHRRLAWWKFNTNLHWSPFKTVLVTCS